MESTTETGMGQLTINFLVTHAGLKCSDCDFTLESSKSKAVNYSLAGKLLIEVKGDSCYLKCGEHQCKDCKVRKESELIKEDLTKCECCHKTFR